MDAFGENKPRGLLARLFGPKTPTIRKTIRRSEILNLVVPTERVETVQTAVDSWLRGHGITAASTVQPKDDGKSQIHIALGTADAAKLDLASDGVQAELQDVITNALH